MSRPHRDHHSNFPDYPSWSGWSFHNARPSYPRASRPVNGRKGTPHPIHGVLDPVPDSETPRPTRHGGLPLSSVEESSEDSWGEGGDRSRNHSPTTTTTRTRNTPTTRTRPRARTDANDRGRPAPPPDSFPSSNFLSAPPENTLGIETSPSAAAAVASGAGVAGTARSALSPVFDALSPSRLPGVRPLETPQIPSMMTMLTAEPESIHDRGPERRPNPRPGRRPDHRPGRRPEPGQRSVQSLDEEMDHSAADYVYRPPGRNTSDAAPAVYGEGHAHMNGWGYYSANDLPGTLRHQGNSEGYPYLPPAPTQAPPQAHGSHVSPSQPQNQHWAPVGSAYNPLRRSRSFDAIDAIDAGFRSVDLYGNQPSRDRHRHHSTYQSPAHATRAQTMPYQTPPPGYSHSDAERAHTWPSFAGGPPPASAPISHAHQSYPYPNYSAYNIFSPFQSSRATPPAPPPPPSRRRRRNSESFAYPQAPSLTHPHSDPNAFRTVLPPGTVLSGSQPYLSGATHFVPPSVVPRSMDEFRFPQAPSPYQWVGSPPPRPRDPGPGGRRRSATMGNTPSPFLGPFWEV